MQKRYTLGIDSSTQGVKACIYDPAEDRVAATASVNFGADLPQYGCPDGVLPNPDPLVKQSDPLMWLDALDMLFGRLNSAGAPMSEIAAIGGDGQQHGSVYLNRNWREILPALNPERTLAEQLATAFARPAAPIWMDSSTGNECRELSARFGGRLQTDTGSPAIERFTGPQIRRFWRTCPEEYANTTDIHLVSSFLCSVLIGGTAPIDRGDGAGMNLLNLHTNAWDPEIAEFTAPGLIKKLPPVRDGRAGNLHPYFAKYGLRPGIPVAVWTGDNPASLVGCGAEKPGCAVVSLGTSDTFFAAMDHFHTDPDGCGHVFGNPAGGCMCLTCFKNGSLARDRVRREIGVDWKFFDETAFDLTPPGNLGRQALPWFEPEITPPSKELGIKANFDYAAAAPEVKIRAVVEGQIGNMREHTRWIGDFSEIRVTGGASRSRGIREVLADIFKAQVVPLEVTDSAALGGAKLAAKELE